MNNLYLSSLGRKSMFLSLALRNDFVDETAIVGCFQTFAKTLNILSELVDVNVEFFLSLCTVFAALKLPRK